MSNQKDTLELLTLRPVEVTSSEEIDLRCGTRNAIRGFYNDFFIALISFEGEASDEKIEFIKEELSKILKILWKQLEIKEEIDFKNMRFQYWKYVSPNKYLYVKDLA